MELENNQEINLGESYQLESITFYFPTGETMSDYYIFYSSEPFSSTDLGTELASGNSNHIYIENSVPSGQEIPIGESQPLSQLDEKRSLENDHRLRDPLQSAV